MPDVVGFDADEACAMVRAAGLVPCGPGHAAAPIAGVVIAQRPLPAAVVLWTGDKPEAGVLPGPSPLALASPVSAV